VNTLASFHTRLCDRPATPLGLCAIDHRYRAFAAGARPAIGTSVAANSFVLWDLMKSDILRTYEYLEGSRFRRFIACAATPGVHAALVYRFGHWACEQPVALRIVLVAFYYLLNFGVKMCWGIDIPRRAAIGPGLYIGHFGGIIISRHAVIGANCSLSHDVTIGISGTGDKRGAPSIGNHVYIGPGAKLFGPIQIGDNTKIGPNAVIHADVPANSVAVAPAFTIISDRGNDPVRVAA